MSLGTISILGGGAGGGADGLAGGRAGGGPEGLAAEGNGGLGGASLISPLIESFSIVGDCTYTKELVLQNQNWDTCNMCLILF